MYHQALKLAYKAHKGQTRRDTTVPYFTHLVRVAGYFNDDLRKTVAILHDILEDTDILYQDLLRLFPVRVAKLVDVLSKKKDEQYFDYIKRVKKNGVATEIKIADIIDNLSDSIQPESMIERYNKSLEMLIE